MPRSLAGVQLRYCPRCGGRLAAFRPQVIAAHARYRTAREGYVFLQGKLDYDVAGPLCLACGCVLDVQETCSAPGWTPIMTSAS